MRETLLAVIPARGGSKGLPGKNLRPLAGLPLIAHSIELARRCPAITQTIVSTDSPEIAAAARAAGADVPFLRPTALAQDDTPTLPVLQHALSWYEQSAGRAADLVLLLQPTGPLRLPEDVARALALLASGPSAVGVIAVSEMPYHPSYVCVHDDSAGYLRRAFREHAPVTRRQDLAPVYRINGMLYLWRAAYVQQVSAIDLSQAPHRMLTIPRERAVDIDDEYDLRLADWTLRDGLVALPWLQSTRVGSGAQ